MRISMLSQFNAELQSFSSQIEKINALRQQMSNDGKKIQADSEDPMLALRIHSLTEYLQQIDGYQLNSVLAENRIAHYDKTIETTLDYVGKAKELIQKAQNDTANNSDRKILAEELKGILNNLISIGNSVDNNGDYIFGGKQLKTPPFIRTGQYVNYHGTQESSYIDLSSQSRVIYNDSGYKIFENINSGNGVFSVSSDAANNTGSAILDSAKALNGMTILSESYQITFVQNSAGKLAYQVIGSQSGQIIPPSGQTTPDNAPEFISGRDIVVNNVCFQIQGSPALNDTFQIKPSEKQSLFNTISDIISVLQSPINDEKTKADLQQKIVELSGSMDQADKNIRMYHSELGGRGKIVDQQNQLNVNLIHDHKLLLKKISESEIESVLMELSQRTMLLELTEQTYVKLQKIFSNISGGYY